MIKEPFSWERAIKLAKQNCIDEQIIQLKTGNPDLRLRHQAEYTDAISDNPNYRELKKRINLEFTQRAERIQRRKPDSFGRKVRRAMSNG